MEVSDAAGSRESAGREKPSVGEDTEFIDSFRGYDWRQWRQMPPVCL